MSINDLFKKANKLFSQKNHIEVLKYTKIFYQNIHKMLGFLTRLKRQLKNTKKLLTRQFQIRNF